MLLCEENTVYLPRQMNVRFLHDGEPGQERLQVVLTGHVVIQSLRGWELTISFHIQFCIMTLAIFFFLCILSPWWSVHWVLVTGSKHSASRWTADERPAWRSQSPATAGNTAVLKTTLRCSRMPLFIYTDTTMDVSVLSPRGWVSSLAAESHNRTWQIPEETSPSAPSGGPAHAVWWCPLCYLKGEKRDIHIITCRVLCFLT